MGDEIYKQLLMDEAASMPDPDYMRKQQHEINSKMRSILVDWLIEVHMKYEAAPFHSQPETLYLTVNLIDRYLSSNTVLRKRLQLVGVVALFIACKFEEINPPELRDFVYITDNAYTKADILDLECEMLCSIGFQISCPTAAHFMNHFEQVNQCDQMHKQLVRYTVELALVCVSMIRYPPSHMSAAAVLFTNELLELEKVWPSPMVIATSYSEGELRGCVEELSILYYAAPTESLQAVRRRYIQEKHHAVARMTFPPRTPSRMPTA